MTASLILSDMLWRDSSMDNSGGGGGAVPAQAAAGALEKMAESDYLRLDSLLLTCQLHVRGLLQVRSWLSQRLKHCCQEALQHRFLSAQNHSCSRDPGCLCLTCCCSSGQRHIAACYSSSFAPLLSQKQKPSAKSRAAPHLPTRTRRQEDAMSAHAIVMLHDVDVSRHSKVVQTSATQALMLGGGAQDKGRKSINIVTEKVSFQGVTRFEDRRRLPLGVATNFSAYAAKVLTQARGARCKQACRNCIAPAPVYPGRLLSSCTGAAFTARLA